jgi:1-acyl-sn-glycerol-3-phosphate acyltransferase
MTQELSYPANQNLSQWLAVAIFRLMGWHVDITYPKANKFLLIGAPHTSNWDFFFFLLLRAASGIKMKWIGKDSLFRGPMAWLMGGLGGIPVNRRVSTNFVDQIIQTFQEHDELVIVIAPEGTRSRSKYWKTGFYYIALGAKVPIVMGYLDYSRKEAGIGPSLSLTGNLQPDLTKIREFYTGKQGKFPSQASRIQFRPSS